ncbi:hypothetical protein SDC9_201324 [bioreactor metagenome]|uniref:Uncharacterized protein n=1 Tax=bioreactor metagenome TaxID=1076179 RepID=A0A645IRU0_9ZZZZ
MHPEFVVDVCYMSLCRMHGNNQLLLDELSVSPFGYEEKYFRLSRRQFVKIRNALTGTTPGRFSALRIGRGGDTGDE